MILKHRIVTAPAAPIPLGLSPLAFLPAHDPQGLLLSLSSQGYFCSLVKFALPEEGPLGDEREEIVHIAEEEEELQDEVQSQSSASSEDYIIILPECFDTSRPLGDSMYSSALSQPGLERGAEGEPGIEAGQELTEAGERLPEGESQPQEQSISDILTTSQTLDTVPLVPEVVGLPPPLSRYCSAPLSRPAPQGEMTSLISNSHSYFSAFVNLDFKQMFALVDLTYMSICVLTFL